MRAWQTRTKTAMFPSPCVVTLHEYFRPEHLEHVKREMLRLGAPIIKGTYQAGRWYAYEGTHRLKAAKALGLAPIMVQSSTLLGQRALIRASFRRCVCCGRSIFTATER